MFLLSIGVINFNVITEGKVIPRNTQWVLSITLSLTSSSDPVNYVSLDLGDSASFSTYTTDGALSYATVSTTPNGITFSSFNFTPPGNGSFSLRDIVITKSEGLKNLTLTLANSTDTVTTNVPVVVVREDTTVPLKFFHNALLEKPVLLGEIVRIRGVVSATLGSKAYIQDTFRDTVAGIVLYGASALNAGELVIAEGEFSPYRGLEEISYPNILYREFVGVPDPTVVDGLNRARERYSGVLVRIDSVRFDTNLVRVPVGVNVPIRDKYGNSGNLYIDRYSDVESFPPPDTIFDLIGVVDEDSGSAGNIYRIVPRHPSDLIFYNSVMVSGYTPFFALKGKSTTWKVALSSFTPVAKLKVCSDGVSLEEMSGALLGSRTPDSVFTSADTACATFWNPSFTQDTLTLPLNQHQEDSLTLLLYSSVDTLDIYRRSVFSPKLYFTTPISEIQAYGEDYSSNLEGQNVLVGGVVLADASAFSSTSTSTYIWDGTGGVNLYSSSVSGLKEGMVVVASGTVTEYNGLTEVLFESVKVLGNDTLPKPIKLERGQTLSEDLEGNLVRVDTVRVTSPPSYAGVGKSFTVYNGTVPITVYVYPTTGIDISSIKVGDYVSVTGIAGQYDNTPPYTTGYQLLPRKPADVLAVGNGAYASDQLDVKISKNVFVVGRETARMEVKGPNGSYTVRIYDGMGRLVKTVVEGGGVGIYEWDGKNSAGRKVSPGMYVLFVSVNTASGTQKVVKPIVVVSR